MTKNVEGSDTLEGRTVFARNVSFDIDNDTLYDFFAEFGPLVFAKVVKDPVTQHSRGTAFIKFIHAADAARVIANSENPENAPMFTLDNRTMNLTLAIPRTQVQKIHQSRDENPDSSGASVANESMAEHLHKKGRNLHLARVGMIRPGTTAAEGLSAEDLARREALYRLKKVKLQNPHIFVSDVRLCVRNLPLTVSDEQLKQVCQEIVGEAKHCRITECRVMRNLQPGRQQFRSLGYAFVTFGEHKHALKVLNELNNNPNVFPNQRRPIVEFSLENMQALEKKRKRAEQCAILQAKRQRTNDPKSASDKIASRRPGSSKTVVSSSKVKQRLDSRGPKSQRVLPKRFGAKNRYRDRSRVGKQTKKPIGRSSRSQIRKKKGKIASA